MSGTRHARTLVLGGGFGGIAVASGLRERLGDPDIVVVDRAPRFSMGLRKLWELVGHGTIAEGSRARTDLAGGGIDVVQAEIQSIDPAARSAQTDVGVFSSDRLVIALGATQRPDLVPGLEDHGHDIWQAANIPGAAAALGDFDGGRILVLVAGAPYPCPPAPYECAFLLDEHLRERSIRERTEITVATVQPMLMPNAGKEGSQWMGDRLDERGIGYQAKIALDGVGPDAVRTQDGEIPFDLLFAVPPHRAPTVLADTGLLGESGWIEVEPRTLKTGVDGVFAVGDCTMIRLANGLPMPKAGLVAELEGQQVARAIAAAEHGAEPGEFDGQGACFIEMGADSAAMFRGRFFEEPAPTIEIFEASQDHAAQKREFEAERLASWFAG